MPAEIALVEIVARAIATEFNQDPDEICSFESKDGDFLLSGPRWKSLISQARQQIASYEAIREFHRSKYPSLYSC